ncbi:MAG: hypothetical protein M3R17_11045 [Bacteroidota bacterium]|nr:hypothetical protein [Bacteroidota bacterium]
MNSILKKYLIGIAAFLFLSGCDPQIQPEEISDGKDSATLSVNENLLSCFVGIDTTNKGHALYCSGAAFKLVSDKYVLYINPVFPLQYDSCYTVTVDSINGKGLARLYVYDHHNAHLTNFCTDLYITNFPEPTRELHAQSGNFILAFTDPDTLYHFAQHVTILVKQLTFIDSKTGEKIEIKNELFWKVGNLGMPG